MITITVIAVGILGLFIGSFLNVVILRLHAGKSYVKGRSACPNCNHALGPLEMLPVLSWLALRGRCRHCSKPISVQYPLVELTTGLFFALTSARLPLHTYGDVLALIFWLYVVGSLIVLAVYDLRWYLLPDKVLLPIIIPAGALLIGGAVATQSWWVLVAPIAAGLAFGGFFYALAAFSRGKWMGGGDIKLAFVMGLLLGFKKTALAMLIAFNSAAIIGLILLALRRKKRSDMMPFGPFLIMGTLLALWIGDWIINWYLDITGLNLL